jgi:hypothetical protein
LGRLIKKTDLNIGNPGNESLNIDNSFVSITSIMKPSGSKSNKSIGEKKVTFNIPVKKINNS